MSHPTGKGQGHKEPPRVDFAWLRAKDQAQKELKENGVLRAPTQDEIDRIYKATKAAKEHEARVKAKSAAAAATTGTKQKPPVPPRPPTGGGSPKGRPRAGSSGSL